MAAQRMTVVITFHTEKPLTQQMGMKMWENGNFTAIAGRRNYSLSGIYTAETLLDAIEGIINTVTEMLAYNNEVSIKSVRAAIDE